MMDIDLSDLSGFTALGYAGPDDHSAMAELLNRWNEANEIPERTSVAEIDNGYTHLDDCKPPTDIVMVVASEGRLAGYCRVEWGVVPGGPTRHWTVPNIDPTHQESPLWLRLAEAAIERNTVIAGGTSPRPARCWPGCATAIVSPTSAPATSRSGSKSRPTAPRWLGASWGNCRSGRSRPDWRSVLSEKSSCVRSGRQTKPLP